MLWQLSGERKLPDAVLSVLQDAEDLLFSVASYAEIGVKAADREVNLGAPLAVRSPGSRDRRAAAV